MFGALIRAAERWRSVKVTEFERRQMAAVRKELDEEYEASVGLNAQPSKDSAQPKICLFPPVHLLLCAKHLLVAATAQLDSFSSEILNGTWLHFGVSRKRGLSQYIRWFFV
jgi:hypothetical protein